jgi:hypothetical protein
MCEICGRWFVPDKYHPTTQRICCDPECRRARKQQLNLNWYVNNLFVYRRWFVPTRIERTRGEKSCKGEITTETMMAEGPLVRGPPG